MSASKHLGQVCGPDKEKDPSTHGGTYIHIYIYMFIHTYQFRITYRNWRLMGLSTYL